MLVKKTLGNSAMERLSKCRAVGVPFSTVGLAVKTRKDTSEKGTPTKRVWQRLATTEL